MTFNWLILAAASVFLLMLGISSFFEKEYRASAMVLALLVLNGFFWGWLLHNPRPFQHVNLILVFLTGFFTLLSFVRYFPNNRAERDTSNALQYDERDHMFSRNNIQYYPDLMETYYSMRPENESLDRQILQKPEFGDKEQLYNDVYTAPVYNAAFKHLHRYIPLSDGEISEEKTVVDPVRFCQTITESAKFYGACDVSFLHLKPYHFYSHRGRQASSWGTRTDQAYKTAITFVIPMRVEMIKNGPTSCVLQESAQKYVEAAKISNIIAEYIRSFGYKARAHNDGNYDTLCVPVAVESGLGELGRMGLLMHKTYGPCVRLAMVTTELELPETKGSSPLFMEEFCSICKKCADNCPSGSITSGDEPSSRNIRHWSIQQEKCFSYWKTIGSDCGLCISVCPYTKPNTLIHKFVRFYISRNMFNQKIALFMDDLLYGRTKKIPKKNPDRIFRHE